MIIRRWIFRKTGYTASRKLYEKDPQVCSKFVLASLKGWIYTFKHTDEALDIVMKYVEEANVGTNRAHQKWMLARMRDLIIGNEPEADLGKLDPEDYSRVGKVLHELNFIGRTPPFDEFYKGPR